MSELDVHQRKEWFLSELKHQLLLLSAFVARVGTVYHGRISGPPKVIVAEGLIGTLPRDKDLTPLSIRHRLAVLQAGVEPRSLQMAVFGGRFDRWQKRLAWELGVAQGDLHRNQN